MVQTRRREPLHSRPLLVTKLHPPVRREQTVVRERLLDRLRPVPGRRLTVIAAPAGCGKTTLLGMWRDAASSSRPVAWLTLDKGDDDIVVLWTHLLEALRRVISDLTVPEVDDASPDVAVRRLVNALAELDEVVLILDDFHQLSNGVARDSLALLIEQAPSTFHLVLGTRS